MKHQVPVFWKNTNLEACVKHWNKITLVIMLLESPEGQIPRLQGGPGGGQQARPGVCLVVSY